MEHIHKLDELFFNINRITTNDAKMIIAVPNNDAAEINFFTNEWVAWDVPRHLYHFNFETLAMLLEKYGWKITKSKNMFQDTFFNIYMSLKGNFIKRILVFLVLIIYSFINQIFFFNKQSSNLVVCKKK